MVNSVNSPKAAIFCRHVDDQYSSRQENHKLASCNTVMPFKAFEIASAPKGYE